MIHKAMNNSYYLVAAALIEEGGERKMPLGGKSIKNDFNDIKQVRQFANEIALELLLRVFSKRNRENFKEANNNSSFVLVKLDIESMNKVLKPLKSKWLTDGNSLEFIENLKKNKSEIWSIEYKKYEGIIYNKI